MFTSQFWCAHISRFSENFIFWITLISHFWVQQFTCYRQCHLTSPWIKYNYFIRGNNVKSKKKATARLVSTVTWPAPNVSGFIAQLVEHRTGNRQVTGSNPVEVLIFFSGFFTQLHKLRSLWRSFLHFHFISAVHIWFISYIINSNNKAVLTICPQAVHACTWIIVLESIDYNIRLHWNFFRKVKNVIL